MQSKTRNALAMALIHLVALGFIFGGCYLIYWQKTGTPTKATVNSCSKSGRAYVCRGAWFVNGSVKLGIIENANNSHLGQRIDVVAMGDRALIPGLRLPIILFTIGAGIAVLGWVWWVKEAPRDRTPKA